MLDIHLLRTNLPFVAERLAARGVTLDVAAFEALEARRKQLQTRTQELQAERNALSKQIGVLKGKGEDASAVLAAVAGIGDELKASEAALAELLPQVDEFLAGIPNLPHESVPPGRDETGNVEVSRWGAPRQIAAPRDHVDLGAALGDRRGRGGRRRCRRGARAGRGVQVQTQNGLIFDARRIRRHRAHHADDQRNGQQQEHRDLHAPPRTSTIVLTSSASTASPTTSPAHSGTPHSSAHCRPLILPAAMFARHPRP